MPYKLRGELLEVCNCKTLCPCWIGQDPDEGYCDASLAYHFTEGQIDGVDVSGLTVATTGHIPGNVFAGNWTVSVYVDERASDEQMEAIVAVMTGKKGGPLADLAKLIGEVKEVRKAPIAFEVQGGEGRYSIGEIVHAEMKPFRDANGSPTKLVDSVFSTIPGSPAYVAVADTFRLNDPSISVEVNLTGHNAIQGQFLFEA